MQTREDVTVCNDNNYIRVCVSKFLRGINVLGERPTYVRVAIENVVLRSLKSFFPFKYQVNINLCLMELLHSTALEN